MGDISDMMLDGTLCELCGQYVGDAVGYPVQCSSCQLTDTKPNPCVCPRCNKLFKSVKACNEHRYNAHNKNAKAHLYRNNNRRPKESPNG